MLDRFGLLTKEVGKSAEQLHRIFTGGSRFFDTTTASTICLMMNVSSSAPLERVCMTRHTVSGAMLSTHGSNCCPQTLNIEDEICVSAVFDNAKALYQHALLGTGTSSIVGR